jgi:hypothetical protein
VATYRFCAAAEVQVLITDEAAEEALIQPFERLGIEVRRV